MRFSHSPQRAVLAAEPAVIRRKVGTGAGTEKWSSEWQLGEWQLEDGVGRDPRCPGEGVWVRSLCWALSGHSWPRHSVLSLREACSATSKPIPCQGGSRGLSRGNWRTRYPPNIITISQTGGGRLGSSTRDPTWLFQIRKTRLWSSQCWMVGDDVTRQLECPLWCRGMPAQAAGQGGARQGGPMQAGWWEKSGDELGAVRRGMGQALFIQPRKGWLIYEPTHMRLLTNAYLLRLPWWFGGEEPACQCRRLGFNSWVRKAPWRRRWQPTLVFFRG